MQHVRLSVGRIEHLPSNALYNRVQFAKWQLKANTDRLNLRTGVFGSATCVVGVKVSGEIAAWKALPEGHQSLHEL